MDIEGHRELKQAITLAEKVIDLKKYESLPFPTIPMVATIDYIVDKFKIQNPAVIEVGPVPGEYYAYPEPGEKYEWATQHYGFTSASDRELDEGSNPFIRYLADLHPDWKLVALGVHDIPQDLKETLLGTHADLYLYDTGNNESHGLSTSFSYHNPEDDIAEAYPKLIKKLGGKRPDIISGEHVFSHSGGPYESYGLTIEACRLLPIGGFFVASTYGKEQEIEDGLPSGPTPFDIEKNMKLVTRMEFSRAYTDGSGVFKTHVLVYQKVADSVNPVFLENMEKMKRVRDEWKAKGWKPGSED